MSTARRPKTRLGNISKSFGLSGFENAYPKTLSGGMRQRVALIRTLIMDPDILLLDEPFSALDYQTRLYLEGVLKEAVETYHKTVILVTHDIDEAVALSKRVVVLSGRPARVKIVHDIDIAASSPDHGAKRQPLLRLFPRALRRARHPDRENRVTLTLPGASRALRKRRARSPRARTFNTILGRSALQATRRHRVLCTVGDRRARRVDFRLSGRLAAPASLPPAIKMLLSGDLLSDTWFTLFEAILGFVIGTILGSLLGLALWYSAFVARLVEPFIVAINSVPKIALAPIVVLWFGTGLVSKVALSVSLTAIVALIAAYQAAKDADVDLQSLLISMGADKHQVFFKAVVPSTLPSIIATFRINIGFGLVGAVVGEFISSQRGLGHLIYTASSLYDLNTVWVGLFTLMIMGFALYYVIDLIERTSLPWKQAEHHASGSSLIEKQKGAIDETCFARDARRRPRNAAAHHAGAGRRQEGDAVASIPVDALSAALCRHRRRLLHPAGP